MRKTLRLGSIKTIGMLFFISFSLVHAEPCTFDKLKNCNLLHDILNDKDSSGLSYYAAPNYAPRINGEINTYCAGFLQPYQDTVNASGQVRLIALRMNASQFRSAALMTRPNIDAPPYNAPQKIHAFTTQDAKHGYIEVRAKFPKCEVSSDGLCQQGRNPASYNQGLMPAIWLLPAADRNWPENGEIDIAYAYQLNRGPYNISASILRFNGTDPRCRNNNCTTGGYPLAEIGVSAPLYQNFHTWGLEWEPDSASPGNFLLTGYFDNIKIWGPITTNKLPADGANALRRGFNHADGGFYLIVSLAIGGIFAGEPDSHLLSASMDIQSIKAYTVDSQANEPRCIQPQNIFASTTQDKRQVTLYWSAPPNSAPILNYQVNDWLDRLLWRGTDNTQRRFTDYSLPGRSGTYVYFLYSNCENGMSAAVKYEVKI